MTIAWRDHLGHTRTFYQDGSRVRISNPGGTDEGEAQIVDLKTTERIVVYDDARAYYDYNKSLAPLRSAVEQYLKKHPPDRKKPPAVSYRALGTVRHVAGLACAMYERVRDGKPDAELCFAPWGGTVGPREDFLWFDELIERMAADVGARSPKRHPHRLAKEEGLALWTSETDDDGKRDTMEIVQINRDPVPFAMLHVPSDYKEFSRPLTASEHPKLGPPPMDDARTRRTASELRKFAGFAALLLAFGLIVGVLINAAFLHLFASVVMEQPRFTQALVAALIISVVVTVEELIHLPSVIETAFGMFTIFAALKISYGASTLRTLAMCAVPAVIIGGAAYVAHLFG